MEINFDAGNCISRLSGKKSRNGTHVEWYSTLVARCSSARWV